MRRGYMTTMPDKSGAFLLASRIILRHGGNITRVSYNKAVDAHVLFVDVEAPDDAQAAIRRELAESGFLEGGSQAKVVLAEFELEDHPGAVLPILEVLGRYEINISYISSQENGTGTQYFKMGLYIEQPQVIQALLAECSRLCPVRILHYDAGEKALDNTVFYITFAGEMRTLLHLNQEQTNDFLFYSNLVMQHLDDRDEPPRKTFEYITRFAHFVAEHDARRASCRITQRRLTAQVTLTVIEPPCGSNISVLEDADGRLLVIDSGFECYREDTHALLRELFDGFDQRPRELLLTHADCDHTGLHELFSVIHLSRRSLDSFLREARGEPNDREQNSKTLPYCRLSKMIAGYHTPALDKLRAIDTLEADPAQPLSLIGRFAFADLRFDVYQGNGGHLPGEIVLIDEENRVAATGDDYVNIHGYLPAQAAYNRLAPYLMTSVNEDSAKAKAILKELFARLDGKGYVILPGHGAVVERGQGM